MKIILFIAAAYAIIWLACWLWLFIMHDAEEGWS